jgi:hypothetical protein
LAKHLRSRPVQAPAFLAAAAAALVLFWLRKHHRRIYASVEFVAATVVVWEAFRSTGAERFSIDHVLAFVSGGVYVIAS